MQNTDIMADRAGGESPTLRLGKPSGLPGQEEKGLLNQGFSVFGCWGIFEGSHARLRIYTTPHAPIVPPPICVHTHAYTSKRIDFCVHVG